jgi:hypothetical protein
MAYLELPIQPDVPHQSFSVELDGAVYGFEFRYNTRGECWLMGLRTSEDEQLLRGVAVRLGVDLLAQYTDDRFPAGRLFAMNVADEYVGPDRNNFGSDATIVYEEAQ